MLGKRGGVEGQQQMPHRPPPPGMQRGRGGSKTEPITGTSGPASGAEGSRVCIERHCPQTPLCSQRD